MLTHSELIRFLRSHGYQETPHVLRSGDFSVRGDLVEWWPVQEIVPWRYHYFGEELEKAEAKTENSWKAGSSPQSVLKNEIETEHGEVRPGEYVVHPFHGVGIFERVESRLQDGRVHTFLSLAYAGNDRLLFPAERMPELMPYIGGRHPRLTRLYSKAWQRTKEKVQKDLIKVARELLKMYAERHQAERSPYPCDAQWEAQIAAGLPFELTGDQQRTWKEILKDFSQPYPMDRLVCGDVGFGKTEVALRAAVQVLAAGKQVAFVAPTTVLAEQHFALLKARLSGFPVRVQHMSRLTAKDDKETLEALAKGEVDFLVGTHRLLGKDVVFKDLGLLILDEEQKFGVAQKEYLKKRRPHLDVLSLSATPIPRTLSLSLSGLRGLSILRTPPLGRKPVETHVSAYDEKALSQALAAEIKRGGQIYVVHNRVQSLGAVRERICELVRSLGLKPAYFEGGEPGEVQVALAHGQMDETALARTMASFMEGSIRILVASSIVEHGLDSPTANTLVVLHSEWFGLSDLYQLRGRVGRRLEQAYAYFFTGGIERTGYQEAAQAIPVTEATRRRLEALMEADELGSGWSIALRDLEIRGGGNILGHEQHGSMEAIGLLLYAQLLQEEIGRQARKLAIPLFRFSGEAE